MISAFTNLRNVVEARYPFVEAILSTLPICDQYVISDGYSTDGTWEILKRLADAHPKIELIRIEWSGEKQGPKGEIIARTANETREHCKGRYLFYAQGNEVVHEDSVERLRNLPDSRPQDTIFHLPYNIMFGTDIVGVEDFRIRFVRNIRNIRVSGDGMHMCYGRADIVRGVLSALAHPAAFETSLKMVMTPYGFDNQPFDHVILPKPIFRYSLMFRKDYVAKLKVRKSLNAYKGEAGRVADVGQYVLNKTNSRNFGEKMHEYYVKNPLPFNSGFLFKPYRIGLREHPRIMQGLFAKGNDSYRIREELIG